MDIADLYEAFSSRQALVCVLFPLTCRGGFNDVTLCVVARAGAQVRRILIGQRFFALRGGDVAYSGDFGAYGS